MAHSTAQTDSAAHLVLSLSCPDRPGIVHAVTGTLARRGGNITESKQFGDSSTGLFFMRVQVLTTVPRVELEKDRPSWPASTRWSGASTRWGAPCAPSSWSPRRGTA